MEDCETAKEKCNYLAVFFVRIRPKLAFSLTLFALNYIFLHSVYFSSFPRRTKISLKRIYEFFLSPWWFHVIVWGFVWSGLSFSSLRQTNAAPPARNQLAAHIYKRRQYRKLKIYFYDNHRDSFSFSSAKRFHFISFRSCFLRKLFSSSNLSIFELKFSNLAVGVQQKTVHFSFAFWKSRLEK